MKYYKVDNMRYGLCGTVCKDAQEIFKIRKANLKTTAILWICYAVDVDPYYIDTTYEYKFPVLIFLN